MCLTVYKCTEQFMHAFTACKRLRVIEKYVFTVYAGIHERLDIFAVVDQAVYAPKVTGASF